MKRQLLLLALMSLGIIFFGLMISHAQPVMAQAPTATVPLPNTPTYTPVVTPTVTITPTLTPTPTATSFSPTPTPSNTPDPPSITPSPTNTPRPPTNTPAPPPPAAQPVNTPVPPPSPTPLPALPRAGSGINTLWWGAGLVLIALLAGIMRRSMRGHR